MMQDTEVAGGVVGAVQLAVGLVAAAEGGRGHQLASSRWP